MNRIPIQLAHKNTFNNKKQIHFQILHMWHLILLIFVRFAIEFLFTLEELFASKAWIWTPTDSFLKCYFGFSPSLPAQDKVNKTIIFCHLDAKGKRFPKLIIEFNPVILALFLQFDLYFIQRLPNDTFQHSIFKLLVILVWQQDLKV